MRRFLLTVAFLSLGAGGVPAEPSLQELHRAPARVQLGGHSLRIEKAYVWRDFMPQIVGPGEKAKPNGVMATMTVSTDGQELPKGFKISAVSLLNKDKQWTSNKPEVAPSATRVEITVRDGPLWEVGSTVEVVVHLAGADGKTLLLREPAAAIHRTD